jgi:nucleoside-specific outer membrane channel protein Tsx
VLLGAGVDLKLPGFDYLQLNLYRRLPQQGRDGESWQLTPVWGMSFPLAGSSVVFDGFIDWVPQGDGSYSHNLHFNPQLKYDLGQRMGLGEKRFYAGLEYSYWHNKYGIRDSAAFKTTQSASSLLLKWHF